MFTGDRSGDWLYRALHKAGFANQSTSVARDDGLKLTGAYVTAVVRCAPPANKPLPAERDACIDYLVRELALLEGARAILALGSFAWDGVLRVLRPPNPRPRFGHGATATIGRYALVGSYHPSQQNTFTGKLTKAMFDDVEATADRLSR